MFVMQRTSGVIFRRKHITGSKRLRRLVDASANANGKELSLIPVAIYWGRSPDKERSFLKLLFSENWMSQAARASSLRLCCMAETHCFDSVSPHSDFDHSGGGSSRNLPSGKCREYCAYISVKDEPLPLGRIFLTGERWSIRY